jgi:hypothetical protein
LSERENYETHEEDDPVDRVYVKLPVPLFHPFPVVTGWV